MSVSVASRPVYASTGISEQGRVVLGFVDEGMAWLGWAIGETGSRYHFEDESMLVAGVQTGLHGSPFLLLRVLEVRVSPVKLMTLPLADLRTLEAAESASAPATVVTRAAEILSAQNLLTEAQLAGGMALLGQWKLTSDPLFQWMGYYDELAMFGLLNDPGEPDLADYQQEAATAAAAAAATPVEFCDYARAYLQLIARAATLKESASQRQAIFQAALETLSPLLFGALDCPRVEGLVAPWEVSAAIEEWLMMGRQLGFARLSLAIQQVIANTPFTQQTGADAAPIVDAYLAGASRLLKTADLGRGQLGQDGASCLFELGAGAAEARVALQPDGIITLASYVPPPPPTKPEKK
jgi:hypothetical protein